MSSPMKVLLIYPYFLDSRLADEDVRVVPQGVFYIAALLKRNQIDVEILNWHDMQHDPGHIRAVLQEKNPAIIGFSILHANRWGGIEIARIAKEINPAVQVVFGGVGATHLWRHFLTHFPEIDVVVRGEGERTFLKLVQMPADGESEGLRSIDGLAFRRDGRPFKTPDAEAICDPDELPVPAEYFDYRHLSLTRGCVADCAFCGSPRFWGRRLRFHSAGYFIQQLEMLSRRGIRFFYVSDDAFTVNRQRVIDICREIIRRRMPINWAAISRVDLVDEDVLAWMRKAGCIQISYGVESGSDAIRKFLNKNVNEHQIRQAFAITQRYGIMARAYFIYGCPGENRDTIQQTIDLMNDIRPLSTIFYILDIFPGTRLYQEMKQRLGVTDDIWLQRVEDIMYFETDPSLSEEAILSFGRRLRDAFYRNLPGYVAALDLIQDDAFAPLHADFFSRLAMTFDQGDYAGVDAIPGKTELAAGLYRRSLNYHPDRRAFLGLGILCQKRGDHGGATRTLIEGLQHFPGDEQLHICLGVSLMNLDRPEEAISHFKRFENNPQALEFMGHCYRALKRTQAAQTCFARSTALRAGSG